MAHLAFALSKTKHSLPRSQERIFTSGRVGAEMQLRVRTSAALAKVPASTGHTTIISNCSFRAFNTLYWPLRAPSMHIVHAHTFRQSIKTFLKKKFFIRAAFDRARVWDSSSSKTKKKLEKHPKCCAKYHMESVYSGWYSFFSPLYSKKRKERQTPTCFKAHSIEKSLEQGRHCTGPTLGPKVWSRGTALWVGSLVIRKAPKLPLDNLQVEWRVPPRAGV